MPISTDPTTTDPLSIIVQNYNKDETLANQLTEASYQFGLPQANADPLVSVRNTLLVASAYAISGKIGRVRIYYDRIAFSALPNPPAITKTVNTTLADVITQLNNYYGLTITTDDYDTSASVAGATVTITAKNTSYLFIGQTTLTFAV